VATPKIAVPPLMQPKGYIHTTLLQQRDHPIGAEIAISYDHIATLQLLQQSAEQGSSHRSLSFHGT